MRQEAKPSVFSHGKGTAQQNGNNGKGAPKKEHLRAENQNPLPFNGTIKTEFMTSNELAKHINAFMDTIFDDWYGCVVTVNNNGGLDVSFSFRPSTQAKGEQDRRAFIPITEAKNNGGNTIMDTVFAVNALQKRNRNFVMSDYASEILYDMVIPAVTGPKGIDPFNPKSYNGISQEIIMNSATGGVIYCTVDCISIDRMLGKLYGSKDSDSKSQIMYMASPVRPLSTGNVAAPNSLTDWMLNINAMTRSKYEETLGKLGMIPNNGELMAVTEKA